LTYDKEECILSQNIEYFVDDRFKTINELSPLLINSFLFGDYAYNGAKGSYKREIKHSNCLRIRNMQEMFDFLIDKLFNKTYYIYKR
jgi:hypothetical protein